VDNPFRAPLGGRRVPAMTGLSYSASSAIAEGSRQAAAASATFGEARDWCLRANTANWESPAAAIFSRWLSDLVLRSRQGVNQAADLAATISRI